MAINKTGTNVDVLGWALVNATTQPSGEYTAEYRGSIDNLDAMLAKLGATDAENDAYYDSVQVTKDTQTGVATISISAGAGTMEAKERIPAGETKMPTVSINGTMLSPPLHQNPNFTTVTEEEGQAPVETPMTLQEISSIEWCLKNQGIVTNGDLPATTNELVKLYARWRMFGIDTYLAPSYAMTITRFIDVKSKNDIKNKIYEAGKVWKFATLAAALPAAVRPVDFDVPAWLAQAPTISYTKDGITVAQTFVGAQAFPDFYAREAEELVYLPPAMPDGYWRDSKLVQLQQSSGEE